MLTIKNMATLYLFVLLNHPMDIKFATIFKPVDAKPPLCLINSAASERKGIAIGFYKMRATPNLRR
jgi:hypothetical protein